MYLHAKEDIVKDGELLCIKEEIYEVVGSNETRHLIETQIPREHLSIEKDDNRFELYKEELNEV